MFITTCPALEQQHQNLSLCCLCSRLMPVRGVTATSVSIPYRCVPLCIKVAKEILLSNAMSFSQAYQWSFIVCKGLDSMPERLCSNISSWSYIRLRYLTPQQLTMVSFPSPQFHLPPQKQPIYLYVPLSTRTCMNSPSIPSS